MQLCFYYFYMSILLFPPIKITEETISLLLIRFTIINSYEQEQIALKEEMKSLQAKIDNLKLELYKNMKINDIFEVM